MTQFAYHLKQHERFLGKVWRFLLAPVEAPLIHEAGQYVIVQTPDGEALPYSIANAPVNEGLLEFHIKETDDSLGVIQAMLESTVQIAGPEGICTLAPAIQQQRFLLLAGSTGFAQCKALFEGLIRVGVAHKQVSLYWGAATREDLYWQDLAREWAAKFPQFTYVPVVSNHCADLTWGGCRGWVQEAVLTDYPDLSNIAIYLSGPESMVLSARDAFLPRGAQSNLLYSDFL